MVKHTYLGNGELSVIENLYAEYLTNPESIDQSWRKFFEGFEFARTHYEGTDTVSAPATPAAGDQLEKEFKVFNLIHAYRLRGHLFTKTNPVRERRKYFPTLDKENFGLTDADLDAIFRAGNEIGLGNATLRAIIEHLDQTYCQSVGAEYKYIRHPEVIKWFEQKMESSRNRHDFSPDEKRKILHKLNHATAFENFLHIKFAGQKRFSLEGSETLIPALDSVIDYGAELGIKEFTIGMAHRGRLNVLANILNKTYEDIFSEFEGKEFEDSLFDGDVKYHLGFSGDVTTWNGKKVHLSLVPNPSHLEAVDPVVQGIVRAKIDTTPGGNHDMIAPILIHGDAAIAAQGIVYEVIQMSLLKGYRTGGTIHIVINNQIGFTTNYADARSSTYCTDVAKTTLSPVFHVNADDVEAVVYTMRLALEYRQKFHRDVFIDLLGYRKYGHNEGDEPRFTQPLLYKAIASHANPREIYNEKLLAQGEVEAGLVKEMENEYKHILQQHLESAKQKSKTTLRQYFEGNWKGLRQATEDDFKESPATGVEKKTLLEIGEKITTLPAGKKFFGKITRLFNERKEMLNGEGRIDWSMAELLAFGTLVNEGHPVRLSGQDSERGTFSQRHALLKVEESEKQYSPLNSISKSQAPFYIYNSLLSEYGVLGFEYGYALAAPQSLVVWEAQFGDFFNGGQIIIDQYLSSGEDKWRRMNGLVLLLPHGYEGQGAEHSSARLERFLTLCAEFNMQVVNCTTPANYFHVLRRQIHRPFRKPLVVLTPKSLLRHPKCISPLSEFAAGKFMEVIDDSAHAHNKISKVIFCSGKVYYDLDEYRRQNKITGTAIIRVEQLYPLPFNIIQSLIKRYSKNTQFLWVQEEPENMGAWTYMLRYFRSFPIQLVSRSESASPATGSHKQHEKEQKELIEKAFN